MGGTLRGEPTSGLNSALRLRTALASSDRYAAGAAVSKTVGGLANARSSRRRAEKLVLVEAGAGFAAEEAAGDHALQEWGWCVGGLFELVVEHVGHRLDGVQAD